MLYKNKKTGVTIEPHGKIQGGDWEPVKAEKADKSAKPVKAEKADKPDDSVEKAGK